MSTSCRAAAGRASGFIGGRGEEHPFGRVLKPSSKSFRNRYGINNRNAKGEAPTWRLTAMVMNHYKRPKSFYVRTKVHYTTEKREVDHADHDRQVQPAG